MNDATTSVDDLVARSNRLGADLRNTDYAGGNTSAKAVATDPVTAEPTELFWVQDAGGDLGTLAADSIFTADSAGFASVVSARSGNTEDHGLADLAVGWRAGQTKVDFPVRSARASKWNRLLGIEATSDWTYAARAALAGGRQK